MSWWLELRRVLSRCGGARDTSRRHCTASERGRNGGETYLELDPCVHTAHGRHSARIPVDPLDPFARLAHPSEAGGASRGAAFEPMNTPAALGDRARRVRPHDPRPPSADTPAFS